jgi:hypothetical protein
MHISFFSFVEVLLLLLSCYLLIYLWSILLFRSCYQLVSKKGTFCYLGLMLQKDGDVDEDVSHRIKAGWLKWRQAFDVLCAPRVSLKLKGKFYWIAIRLVMLYGAEC